MLHSGIVRRTLHCPPVLPAARITAASRWFSRLAAARKPDNQQLGMATLPAPLLSVAPMMDYTDVHFRQLMRLISRQTWLWTEMVVDKTIMHAPSLDKQLWFPQEQHPIVLQLGGSDPELLAQAVKVAAAYGYDEINLNCGCPSDRVAGSGCFGAAMMMQPTLVAECMKAIGDSLPAEVSVKCRLGADQVDTYAELCEFIKVVSEGSRTRHFIIHARKCFLKGLNPAQNRSVPPLRHEWVYALSHDFPHLMFSLNGGVLTCHEAAAALALESKEGAKIAGVMIGRAAYNDPWGAFSDADVAVFGAEQNAATSRRQVLTEYAEYADSMYGRWQIKEDGHHDPGLRVLFKPLLNMFHGQPGCKRWKQSVDQVLKSRPTSVKQVLSETLQCIPDWVLDAPPFNTPDPFDYTIGDRPIPADHAGSARPERIRIHQQTASPKKGSPRKAKSPTAKSAEHSTGSSMENGSLASEDVNVGMANGDGEGASSSESSESIGGMQDRKFAQISNLAGGIAGGGDCGMAADEVVSTPVHGRDGEQAEGLGAVLNGECDAVVGSAVAVGASSNEVAAIKELLRQGA